MHLSKDVLRLSKFDRWILMWLRKRGTMMSLELIKVLTQRFWFVRFRIYGRLSRLEDRGYVLRSPPNFYSLTTKARDLFEGGVL